MKKTIKYSVFLLLILMGTSCLDANLNELPTFDEADIIKVDFEHRWLKEGSEFAKLQLIGLNTQIDIDTIMHTITCDITLPAAKNEFTDSIRNLVNLEHLVAYVDISTAATLEPVGDAPLLGTIGDFSKKDLQYKVTAANGFEKVWTINVNELIK